MCPEQIVGTNRWTLLEGEYIEGGGMRIDGPQEVRLEDFEELPDVFVAQGVFMSVRIELSGKVEDFPKHVKTRSS